jgi:hypothetical protein
VNSPQIVIMMWLVERLTAVKNVGRKFTLTSCGKFSKCAFHGTTLELNFCLNAGSGLYFHSVFDTVLCFLKISGP